MIKKVNRFLFMIGLLSFIITLFISIPVNSKQIIENNNRNDEDLNSIETFGFGFSKNNNHQVPDIGSYFDVIAGTDSYYVKDTDEKELYLTFDAGYDNGNLGKILDVLKEKEIKAIFFVTGDFVNREKELLLRIVSEGHLVGNHTYHHKNITKLNEKQIEEEIELLNTSYENVTGKQMSKFFRPPEGEFDKKSLLTVKNLGYKTFFWSIAYNDWNTKVVHGEDYAYKMIMDNLHNGAVILLHTVSSDNASALGKIIDDSRALGYSFKTLEEFN